MSVTDPSARRVGGPSGHLDAETGVTGDNADGGAPPPDAARTPVEVIVLACGAVLVGIVARFVVKTPLWLDEALSVNIAALDLSEIPDALRQDGHPPLYYVLLHLWMEVVGTSDTAVRALSGVLATATLPLAWYAGRRRGGTLLGWLTVAVLAVAPFAVRYASETRMYALVILLVFAGYLLVDRAVRDGHDGPLWLAAIAAITTMLLYTHYWSFWLAAATALVVGRQAVRADEPAVRRASRRVLLAGVVGGLAFVPWLGVLAAQAADTGTPWAGPQRPTSMVASLLTDLGGGDFRDAELGGAVILVLVLLGLFGRAVDARHISIELGTVAQLRHEAVVGASTLCIGALVGYLTVSAWATRYAAVVFPFVVLLVAAGVSRFAGRMARDVVLVAVLVFGLLGVAYNVRGERTQARVIAAQVAARAGPDDVVVYCPDQLGPAGAREMPAAIDQVVFPTLDAPGRVDWRDYEERNAASDPAAAAAQIVATLPSDAAVFLVWSGGYRTFDGKCEALLEQLTASLGTAEVLVDEDGDTYFEHAQLVRIGPST